MKNINIMGVRQFLGEEGVFEGVDTSLHTIT